MIVCLLPMLAGSQVFPHHIKEDGLLGKVKKISIITNDTRELYIYNEEGWQTDRWFFKPVEVLLYRYKAVYNDKDQLLEETKFDKGISPVTRYVYGYDSKGLKIGRSFYSQNNTLIDKYIYVYDSAKRMTDSIRFDQNENMSQKYSWHYDAKGRKTRYTRSGPHIASVIADYEYNASGQLSAEKFFIDGVFNNGAEYSYNEKTEERRFFNSKNKNVMISKLDSNKNVIAVTNFTDDGMIITKFRYVFDRSGNMLEEIKSDSTDHILSRLVYKYDSLNNRVETKRYFQQATADITLTWKYEYDKAGNWTKRVQFINGMTGETIKREIEYY